MALTIDLIFYFIVFLIIGAILGSFASAILHRVGTGASWIFSSNQKPARSECPHCRHVLGVQDLIPIFSYALLKGRCRYCKNEIQRTYLYLELFSVVFVLAIYLIWGLSLIGVLLVILYPFVLVQSILYYRSRVISLQLCAIIGCVILFYVLAQFLNRF